MKASYLSGLQILQDLNRHKLQIVSPLMLNLLYPHLSKNTIYAMIKRLAAKKLITPLLPGLYNLTMSPLNTYQIANIMVPQSYISLETALNYYGILSQFPASITSITVTKTKTLQLELTYTYTHIKPDLFHSFEKVNGVLMATPEKAIIDYLYLASKGLRNSDISEFDLTNLDSTVLNNYPWSRAYVKPTANRGIG